DRSAYRRSSPGLGCARVRLLRPGGGSDRSPSFGISVRHVHWLDHSLHHRVLAGRLLFHRQTIAAYPQGGGSYTVANETLGQIPGLLAATALSIDYVLNVAVAISAGVGALVSAVPSLLPYTLLLCLGILTMLTLVNLRGVRSAGLIFMLPTYLFVGSLATV